VRALVWERDRATWPLAEASRFVDVAGMSWHVQSVGDEALSAVLLLHGTGASTHSWRALMPLLAARRRVVAIDLPGHGFTQFPPDVKALTLPGMADAVAQLVRALACKPALIVGHSAGAAVAVRLVLDGAVRPRAVVGLNSALLPLHGPAWPLFSPLAKLLALTPWVPRVFSWQASDPRVLRRLLDGTGSRLDDEGVALYGRLVASPTHVAGALGMMANWQLEPLAHELPRLPQTGCALHLVAGERDGTVPPSQSRRVQRLVPGATLTVLPGLGHLAHEEQPGAIARLIDGWASG
jgi:magnesium chelatase accessory protein